MIQKSSLTQSAKSVSWALTPDSKRARRAFDAAQTTQRPRWVYVSTKFFIAPKIGGSRRGFLSSALGQFFATGAGRVTRVVAGIVLILWGYLLLPSAAGTVLIVIGLVPLVAGLFDVCVISALVGGPFQGAAIRKAGKNH